jgi:PTH2 family peptidyl-tRNA hydrolase
MPASSEAPTLAVLVRQDLGMGPGKVAAQVGHAAVGCSLASRTAASHRFERWRNEHGRLVVLAVPDEEALRTRQEQAEVLGIVHKAVRDAGRTEVPAGTWTVLGLGPAPANVLAPLIEGLATY